MSKIIVQESVQRIIPDAPDMVLKTVAGGRGPKGDSMLSGHGAPADELGVDGDTYLDLDTGNWYGPKATGAWGGPVANSLLPLVAAAAASADQAAANRVQTDADVATTHADRQDADAAATATAADRTAVAAMSRWTTVSADHQVAAFERLKTDSTAGGFNLITPAAPADGDQFQTFDAVKACTAHPVVLKPNGHKIRGAAVDYPINVNGAALTWVFTTYTDSWEFL